MALALKKVESGYGRLKVLFDISLAVEKGTITTLLGPNGAGKTTTLLTAMGVVKPWSGHIYFGGEDITQIPPHKKVELGIALVPEGRRLFPDMTVLDNLLLGAYVKRARDKAYDTLEWVYALFPILKERRSQKAGTLSGGEQQMLAIARSLMSRPKVLLIDEPSAGLAPKIVESIFQNLQKLREEVSVLLSEQNVAMALEVCDYGYVIENGQIVLEGPADGLANNEHVKRAYLGV